MVVLLELSALRGGGLVSMQAGCFIPALLYLPGSLESGHVIYELFTVKSGGCGTNFSITIAPFLQFLWISG